MPLSRLKLPGFARRSKQAGLEGQPVDPGILDACSHAMRHLGGPRLERLGVVSAVRGEGRSSIATAMAFAQSRDYGRSTLLIDADFDGPGLASRFGVASGPGLSELLRGRASLDLAIRPVAENLTLMTAGEIDSAPSRLANDLVGSGLLAELQMEFPAIVADLPALLGSPSGVLLAEAFDSMLLVVRAETTPVSKVREALSPIQGEPFVMLNGTRSSLPGWLRRFLI
jgi:Mrp family chromosome partitioning ATPase